MIRTEAPVIRLFRDEIIVLTILWLFWLGGTAAATQFEPCRVLSALLAFAWLGFITLTFLIGVSCRMSYVRGGLTEPLPVNGSRSNAGAGATTGKTTASV
ncbi:hypothetical protein D9758_009611 [Tetrapyrgos nigripes]|uniref:MARVEL domain-containing protein n=1 Tax=Tetrapyrgos nigripes TaxID=182062 RepID=A0A8H5GD67_9AGAR|nr:hypothetical protein D9758_009611 [Tetrapyrgos nigripes]